MSCTPYFNVVYVIVDTRQCQLITGIVNIDITKILLVTKNCPAGLNDPASGAISPGREGREPAKLTQLRPKTAS